MVFNRIPWKIFTAIPCVLVLGIIVASTRDVLAFPPGEIGTASKTLPTGPPPYQALVISDRNGNVTMKTQEPSYHWQSVNDPKGGSISYVQKRVSSLRTRQVQADQVQAYDINGKPIAAKRLHKLLRAEVVVLISSDGKAVDPLHLRLYKEDLVILVIPVQDQNPPTLYFPPEAPPAPVKAGPPGELVVSIHAPQKHRIGSEPLFQIVVSNSGGTRVAKAKAYVHLPDNLNAIAIGKDLKNDRLIVCEVGDLEPGENRFLDLRLRATDKGEYRIKASVSAEPNLKADTEFRATFVDALTPGLDPARDNKSSPPSTFVPNNE